MNIADVILSHAEAVLLPLVPDSEIVGDELIGRNPQRNGDTNPGSFKINLSSGKWADFAEEGVTGGDVLSFIAHCMGTSNKDARKWAQQQIKGKTAAPVTEPKQETRCVMPVPEGVERPGNPDRVNGWSSEWAYTDKDGALLFLVRRYEKATGKEHRTWTYRDNGQWATKRPPKPWPLYNLGCFIDEDLPIFVTEGEKCATAADSLLDGIGTTVLGGSSGVKDADLSPLHGRHVVIVPDADEPGRKYAQELVARLQDKTKSLRVVDVWQLGWKDGQDIADIEALPADWDSAVIKAADWQEQDPKGKEQAETKNKADIIRQAVDELARMDSVEYAVLRSTKARELGVTASELDKWVQEKRKDAAEDEGKGQGRKVKIEEPQPWPSQIDGEQLANDVRQTILKYVILPKGAAAALTLFILHTYLFEKSYYTPRIHFTGPLKRCGKSTGVRIVGALVSKKIKADRCSVSALFRLIEAHRPSILLDEVDTYLVGSNAHRGVINSGFEHDGAYILSEGDDNEPRQFSTFAPMVLSGIGDLDDTAMDRAIVIRMRRKTPDETVQIFRRAAQEECAILRQKLRRWADDHLDKVEAVSVDMPDFLNDREQDIWEQLFQIAQLLGGDWQDIATESARAMHNRPEAMSEDDLKLELLSDVREILVPSGGKKFTSEWICGELVGLEGRPWETYSNNAHITQLDLAKLLGKFEIHSGQLKVTTGDVMKTAQQVKENYRGYKLGQFIDAWNRYLQPLEKEEEGGECVQVESTSTTNATENPEKVEKPENVAGVAEVDATTAHTPPVPVHPETGKEVPYYYITDLQEAVDKLDVMTATGETLGADLETRPQAGKERKGAALSPETGQARLLQLYDGWSVLVIDLDQVPLTDLAEYLIRCPLVFHNSDFDTAFLLASGIDVDAHCTQLETIALTAKNRPSLAWACEQFLGYEVDKAEQVSDWSGELTDSQIHYAALDAVLVHALHQKLQTKLEEKKITGYPLVQNCIRPIACARKHGVLLDVDRHQSLVEKWTAERDEAKARFLDIAEGVDPESPKQLAEWLSGNLEAEDLKAWPTTGKGQLSTDADTLKQFAHVSLVRPLLDYRHAGHRVKTWGHTYQRHLCSDGRIRPGFQLLGARTGRMSSQRPNVQNLPRDPEFRACFMAPDGYQLVAADYSQIELRIPGVLSGDKVIVDSYKAGTDLHRKIVHIFTGKPMDEISGDERKLGKAVNFGLLYAGGAKTLQAYAQTNYGLDISLEQAEQYKQQFDQTYKKLRFWQLEQYRQHREQGAFLTTGGRLVIFRDRNNCYTDSRNYPIQGAAADLQMLAIARVHKHLVGPDVHLVNFVHDELVLEVAEDRLQEVSDQLILTMTDAFMALFGGYPTAKDVVHGLVEAGAGKNYAEAKEDN